MNNSSVTDEKGKTCTPPLVSSFPLVLLQNASEHEFASTRLPDRSHLPPSLVSISSQPVEPLQDSSSTTTTIRTAVDGYSVPKFTYRSPLSHPPPMMTTPPSSSLSSSSSYSSSLRSSLSCSAAISPLRLPTSVRRSTRRKTRQEEENHQIPLPSPLGINHYIEELEEDREEAEQEEYEERKESKCQGGRTGIRQIFPPSTSTCMSNFSSLKCEALTTTVTTSTNQNNNNNRNDSHPISPLFFHSNSPQISPTERAPSFRCALPARQPPSLGQSPPLPLPLPPSLTASVTDHLPSSSSSSLSSSSSFPLHHHHLGAASTTPTTMAPPTHVLKSGITPQTSKTVKSCPSFRCLPSKERKGRKEKEARQHQQAAKEENNKEKIVGNVPPKHSAPPPSLASPVSAVSSSMSRSDAGNSVPPAKTGEGRGDSQERGKGSNINPHIRGINVVSLYSEELLSSSFSLPSSTSERKKVKRVEKKKRKSEGKGNKDEEDGGGGEGSGGGEEEEEKEKEEKEKNFKKKEKSSLVNLSASSAVLSPTSRTLSPQPPPPHCTSMMPQQRNRYHSFEDDPPSPRPFTVEGSSSTKGDARDGKQVKMVKVVVDQGGENEENNQDKKKKKSFFSCSSTTTSNSSRSSKNNNKESDHEGGKGKEVLQPPPLPAPTSSSSSTTTISFRQHVLQEKLRHIRSLMCSAPPAQNSKNSKNEKESEKTHLEKAKEKHKENVRERENEEKVGEHVSFPPPASSSAATAATLPPRPSLHSLYPPRHHSKSFGLSCTGRKKKEGDGEDKRGAPSSRFLSSSTSTATTSSASHGTAASWPPPPTVWDASGPFTFHHTALHRLLSLGVQVDWGVFTLKEEEEEEGEKEEIKDVAKGSGETREEEKSAPMENLSSRLRGDPSPLPPPVLSPSSSSSHSQPPPPREEIGKRKEKMGRKAVHSTLSSEKNLSSVEKPKRKKEKGKRPFWKCLHGGRIECGHQHSLSSPPLSCPLCNLYRLPSPPHVPLATSMPTTKIDSHHPPPPPSSRAGGSERGGKERQRPGKGQGSGSVLDNAGGRAEMRSSSLSCLSLSSVPGLSCSSSSLCSSRFSAPNTRTDPVTRCVPVYFHTPPFLSRDQHASPLTPTTTTTATSLAVEVTSGKNDADLVSAVAVVGDGGGAAALGEEKEDPQEKPPSSSHELSFSPVSCGGCFCSASSFSHGLSCGTGFGICMAREAELSMLVASSLLLPSSKYYPPPPTAIPTHRSQIWSLNYRKWVMKKRALLKPQKKKKQSSSTITNRTVVVVEVDALLPMLSESMHYYLSQLGLPDGDATFRLVAFLPPLKVDEYYWDRLHPLCSDLTCHIPPTLPLSSPTSPNTFSSPASPQDGELPSFSSFSSSLEQEEEETKKKDIKKGGGMRREERSHKENKKSKSTGESHAPGKVKKKGEEGEKDMGLMIPRYTRREERGSDSDSFSSNDRTIPALCHRFRRRRRHTRSFTPPLCFSPESIFFSSYSSEPVYALTPEPPSPRSQREWKKRIRRRREVERKNWRRARVESEHSRSRSSSSSSSSSTSSPSTSSSSSRRENDNHPCSRRLYNWRGNGGGGRRTFSSQSHGHSTSFQNRVKAYESASSAAAAPSSTSSSSSFPIRPSPYTQKVRFGGCGGGSRSLACTGRRLRSSHRYSSGSPTPYAVGGLYSQGLPPAMLSSQHAPFLLPPTLPRALLSTHTNAFLHPLRSVPICFLQIPSWRCLKDITEKEEGKEFLRAVWAAQESRRKKQSIPSPPLASTTSSTASPPWISSHARVIRFIKEQPLTYLLQQHLLRASMEHANATATSSKSRRRRKWGVEQDEEDNNEEDTEEGTARWKESASSPYYSHTSPTGCVVSPAILGGVCPCSIYLLLDPCPPYSPLASDPGGNGLSSPKEKGGEGGEGKIEQRDGSPSPASPSLSSSSFRLGYSMWGCTKIPKRRRKQCCVVTVDGKKTKKKRSGSTAGGDGENTVEKKDISPRTDLVVEEKKHVVEEYPLDDSGRRRTTRSASASSSSSSSSIYIPDGSEWSESVSGNAKMTTISSSTSTKTILRARTPPLYPHAAQPSNGTTTITLTEFEPWNSNNSKSHYISSTASTSVTCPFFIAHTMEDYYRLAAAFGWLYGWQLCYAPGGPPLSALSWLKWFNPGAVVLAKRLQDEIMVDEEKEELELELKQEEKDEKRKVEKVFHSDGKKRKEEKVVSKGKGKREENLTPPLPTTSSTSSDTFRDVEGGSGEKKKNYSMKNRP